MKKIKKDMKKEGLELPDYVIEAIEEVLAEDPRLYVDITSSSAYRGLQCNGQNPRYNTFCNIFWQNKVAMKIILLRNILLCENNLWVFLL